MERVPLKRKGAPSMVKSVSENEVVPLVKSQVPSPFKVRIASEVETFPELSNLKVMDEGISRMESPAKAKVLLTLKVESVPGLMVRVLVDLAGMAKVPVP